MDPIARLLTAPGDLPVAAGLPRLVSALTERGVAVVTAPPGSGKTTLVPPAVASTLPPGQRVVVTQPRRIAARAAARRLAALLGEPVGVTAGFAVRGERAVSPVTRVEVVTAGLLLRRLQADPELAGVGAVVLDEVHERTLETDLLQALLLEVRAALRPELRVVAMSATVAAEPLAQYWGGPPPTGGDAIAAPIIAVPGTLHPVTTLFRPPARPLTRVDERGTTRDFLAHVIATTRRALAEQVGDALVFVPGAREVDAVAAGLTGGDWQVLRLHGRMPATEQDRALTGGARRRVVVTTAVAESSLTVPGVGVVVDAGLVREPRTDHRRGLAGLVTVRVSQAAAQQRAGRAGRQGPGVAYRCWSAAEHATLAPFPPPEIATADLAAFALEAACWSRGGVAGLTLPEAPPPAALRAAITTLQELGALDAGGVITPRGRQMAQIPADPRLARGLLDGAAAVGSRLAAEVVALLAEDVRAPGGDLVAALRAVRAERGATPWRRTRDRLIAAVTDSADRDGAHAGAHAGAGGGGGGAGDSLDSATGLVVALCHPDRLARLRRGSQTSYLLASGTGAVLPPESPLRGQTWLAVADADRSARADAIIRSAVPVDEHTALAAGAALRTTTEEVTLAGTRLVARRVDRLGAIELSATRLPAPPARQAAAALRAELERTGGSLLTWSPAATALRDRLALLHRVLGEAWPEVSDAALVARVAEWWPERTRDLAQLDLVAALRALLPWPAAARLNELVPQQIALPSGRTVTLDYSGQVPVLAARVQDLFGLRETPRVVEGRVTVVVHLLSPAGRPAAITSDLAGFWTTGYAAVRAELRGRYPKHAWPERP